MKEKQCCIKCNVPLILSKDIKGFLECPKCGAYTSKEKG